jgi:hypothetical protein
MSKYGLTEEEVESIETEARLDRWPMVNGDYLYAHIWKEDYGKRAKDGSVAPEDGKR